MWDALLQPLHYDYMVKAMLVSGLVGGVCGLLSCFTTLKGWSLLGDALSHAVAPGVAVAWLAGLPFSLGAFAAGLLAAGAIAVVGTKTRLREDAVIGVVFTAFFALGVFIASIRPAQVNLSTIIQGNVLAIADADAAQVVGLAVLVLAVLAVKWRDLMLFCFDPTQARTLGLPVKRLRWLLLMSLAATAVAALQAVGAILVAAMLVTPGATAHLLTDRFPRMMTLAAALGAGGAVAGAWLSWFVNGATGGCIVVVQTFLFLAAFIFAPKHGLLAARRRRAGSAAPTC